MTCIPAGESTPSLQQAFDVLCYQLCGVIGIFVGKSYLSTFPPGHVQFGLESPFFS